MNCTSHFLIHRYRWLVVSRVHIFGQPSHLVVCARHIARNIAEIEAGVNSFPCVHLARSTSHSGSENGDKGWSSSDEEEPETAEHPSSETPPEASSSSRHNLTRELTRSVAVLYQRVSDISISIRLVNTEPEVEAITGHRLVRAPSLTAKFSRPKIQTKRLPTRKSRSIK